ncbi:hypothetical protein CORC01_07301 [Colletotrichum orchidophilum]|uniref:Uncharacterized protein n=1 Tax=Colletotrichum orchidophilum TaxID=1209926 RepID=A0A1G4B7S8_9PEZI|nr:uncharacterized protein CORC01_07301 [Colletotrichum orchidophilum]OHE97396.1 hypothetical protein CORC01_07301 [Colletotrichum orchidophilum]
MAAGGHNVFTITAISPRCARALEEIPPSRRDGGSGDTSDQLAICRADFEPNISPLEASLIETLTRPEREIVFAPKSNATADVDHQRVYRRRSERRASSRCLSAT